MKQIILTCVLFLGMLPVKAQPALIYHPEADAKAEIQQAVKKARAEEKHVFLQIGGNWCPWCIRFHHFVDDHAEINNYVDSNFVVLNVNYSKENKNLDVLKRLGFPQRFGFPVFVILDGNGKRIHTQNSAYLEKDGGYSEKEVLVFFKQWSPKALDPASYQSQ